MENELKSEYDEMLENELRKLGTEYSNLQNKRTDFLIKNQDFKGNNDKENLNWYISSHSFLDPMHRNLRDQVHYLEASLAERNRQLLKAKRLLAMDDEVYFKEVISGVRRL